MLERILAGLSDAPPELHAVAARCTAPAPDDRYADAGALAAELAAFLAGRRVSAYAYRRSELLRRFARVHRLPLAIVGVGVAILVAVGVIYVSDVAHERELAEGSAHETSLALERSDRHLARSLVGEARRLLALGAVPEAALLAAHAATLVEDPEARGLLASTAGTPTLQVTSRARLPCEDAQVDPLSLRVLCSDATSLELWDMAGPDAHRLWRRELPVRIARLVDGGVAVALSADYEMVLLDADGRETLRDSAPNNPTRRAGVAGARVVFESSIVSVVADLAGRSVTPVVMCDGDMHAADVLSADPATDGGEFDLILCRDGRLRFADGRDVRTELIAPQREGLRMARANDGIVVGTTKGEVVVLDRDGRELVSGHVVVGMVRVLAPSPDGRLLAVAGEDDPIVLLSLPDLAVLGALPRRVKSVVWHPVRTDELITTGSWLERWHIAPPSPSRPLGGAYLFRLADGVVSLDAEPGATERVAVAFGPFIARLSPDAWLERHAGFVTTKGIAFAGNELVALGVGGLHTYDAETFAPHSLAGRPTGRRLAALADGTFLVGLYGIVNRGVGAAVDELVRVAPLDISVSPDRRFGLVLLEPDRSFWRVAAGRPELVPVGADPHAEAVAIGPGGATIYAARRGEVAAWDDDGTLVRVLEADDTPLIEVAVSADGRWVAAGGIDGSVWVWDATESEPRARFHDHLERVPALAFSPDGRWLLTGSWDRTLRVRDLEVLDAPPARLEAELAGRYHLDLGEALGATEP